MMSNTLSETMKNTTGFTVPLWFKDCPEMPKHSPLRENLNVDVCVVGAGIGGIILILTYQTFYLGLTTAYLLAKKANKSVAILEAREICSGETGRTTAHLVT